ncbi:aldo/keto reductase [Beijerinckia sp. L45]|uniref:aldo/keto reductase n=1 Tax=Beijerinckia sp. L45 TaxID=1641855 RepID=UPI00131B4420|nr:aldo/keto reductase [Beijerinckia sp. L45]
MSGAADLVGGALCASGLSLPAAFYNRAQGLTVSSIGIGTHRGASDDQTDAAYRAAIGESFRRGINLVDTAINYRNQRSERAVGEALRTYLTAGGRRDQITICTKGGFLMPDAIPPALQADDVAASRHSIAPLFLRDQIDRSRCNLGIATIDVYYLHNPEVQLASARKTVFQAIMRQAFEALELAVSDGKIRFYGVATWTLFHDDHVSLQGLFDLAQAIAGDEHHFRFLQVPFNLGMRDAQQRGIGGKPSLIEVAAVCGMSVLASAPILQGRLAADLPDALATAMPGLTRDSHRALQFVRSTPGIVAALVGMRRLRHVADNLALATEPLLSRDAYEACCALLDSYRA